MNTTLKNSFNNILVDASIFIHANYSIYKYDGERLAERVRDQVVDVCSQFGNAKITLALDTENNFRKKIYPEYKAHRDKSSKFNRCLVNKVLSDIFNTVSYNGLEADDILFLLSHTVDNPLIISMDSDMKMIGKPLYRYRLNEYTDLSGEVLLYTRLLKIISGDKKDNVPPIKIKTIGPKGLSKWMGNHRELDLKGSLDALEDEGFINNWQLNYDLLMYDIDTYHKYEQYLGD